MGNDDDKDGEKKTKWGKLELRIPEEKKDIIIMSHLIPLREDRGMKVFFPNFVFIHVFVFLGGCVHKYYMYRLNGTWVGKKERRSEWWGNNS